MKQRIYIDTSVVGGYFDDEFKEATILLFERLDRKEELGKVISKKRSYISRVENDGSNMNLKTLYDIVEKGLGGKVNIAIEI